MPLVEITLLKGRSEADLSAISGCVHSSLVVAYDMDERDRFQIINEVERGRLIFSPDYAGGPRSDGFLIIRITSMPRSKEMKESFFRLVVERLHVTVGMRPEDVFICLSDQLVLEDISFANGVSAAELAARHKARLADAKEKT